MGIISVYSMTLLLYMLNLKTCTYDWSIVKCYSLLCCVSQLESCIISGYVCARNYVMCSNYCTNICVRTKYLLVCHSSTSLYEFFLKLASLSTSGNVREYTFNLQYVSKSSSSCSLNRLQQIL